MFGPKRRENCLHLQLRGGDSRDGRGTQGQRKLKETFNHGLTWLRKSVGTAYTTALVPSSSLPLFHTLGTSRGETEAQRQEITGTGTHSSLVASRLLRRGLPRLSCSREASASAPCQHAVIISVGVTRSGWAENQTSSGSLSAEFQPLSRPQVPTREVGWLWPLRQTAHVKACRSQCRRGPGAKMRRTDGTTMTGELSSLSVERKGDPLRPRQLRNVGGC